MFGFLKLFLHCLTETVSVYSIDAHLDLTMTCQNSPCVPVHISGDFLMTWSSLTLVCTD